MKAIVPMFKRRLARMTTAPPSTILLRLDWIEALQAPGCALCRLAQQKSLRYVDTLLQEAVTDVAQRDAWRAARGLCHSHAWMAVTIPHSAGCLALLYADVLGHDLAPLASLTATSPAPPRWRTRRALGQRLRDWLRSWEAPPACLVCGLWTEQERLYLQVLLDDWQEPELAQAFTAAHGLCWRHTQRLVGCGLSHRHIQAVLTAQAAHMQTLQQDLQEFIRKQDYRFASEAYGREADVWRRAVTFYVREPGAAGSESVY
ncbi:MAG: hypothetical protein FJZ47_16990 [Candidatus Tectomicrobia bacterium]|uniref:Uncharacterized protein n=1 Tax=Tectimicrobiota bacterium TaxID=2528274 RepID=A0A938B3W4_UNCTE|nr:hypothetical protein [Candidatus Tectomicrobia bacterium]